MRQKRSYLALIEGEPGAVYYFFASADPGYVYLDPPTSKDPRFLDLALGAGFLVVGAGMLDATGHATFSGTVPDNYTDQATIVFQAAMQAKPGRIFTEISNPLLVRFLTAECSK